MEVLQIGASKKKKIMICGFHMLNELLYQVILRPKHFCNSYFGELNTNNQLIWEIENLLFN